MSAAPARQPEGTPAGGQFTPTAHSTPDLSLTPSGDWSRFPHPDPAYPHPMTDWPQGVQAPAGIEISFSDRFQGYGNKLLSDPQTEQFADLPCVTVTMANGASVSIQRTFAGESVETEETLSGDWAAYTGGDKDTLEDVTSVANETLSQVKG